MRLPPSLHPPMAGIGNAMTPLNLFEYGLAIAGSIIVIRFAWFAVDVIVGGAVGLAKGDK